MYGLDSFVLEPPLSTIFSILLIVGLDGIGLKLLGYLCPQNENFKWLRWQAAILGALVLTILLYPIALFGNTGLIFFQIVGVIIIAISLIHIYRLSTNTSYSITNFVSDLSEDIKSRPRTTVLRK